MAGLITSLKSIRYPVDRFGVLVIDDASTVPITLDNICKEVPDIPVTLKRLETNSGICAALNEGLAEIQKNNSYKYIARLDCGDTCFVNRFSLQVKFFENNPEVGLLGTWCQFESIPKGISYIYSSKCKHEDILKEMYFRNTIIHPTVMFRTAVLEQVTSYPTTYPHAEDYAFFWQIMKHWKAAVIPEVLVNIEISSSNISYRHRRKQFNSRRRIIYQMGSNSIRIVAGILYTTCIGLIPASVANRLKSFLK